MNNLETLEIVGDGNSKTSPKQSIQLKQHCFTYNNYKPEHIQIIETTFLQFKKIDKFVFQEEIGEQGTPHLQGSVWFKTKTRWEELKLPFGNRMRWSKMRNEEACIKYCQKSDTAKPDTTPHIFGFPKPIKIIENLRPFQQDIENLFHTEPDGRSVNWYWEATGCIGKSALCKYMYVKHKCCIVRGGKLSDIMNIIFNTDMDECRMIIFDIPRGTGGHVSYTSLEAILDGLITNTKYETGCKVFNPPHVVCLANFPPDDLSKLSQDRWNIKEIC